jgi:hypothetical protein
MSAPPGRQYRPTAQDWQPYHAELQQYPQRHPHHWIWLELQKSELQMLANEIGGFAAQRRPDIYDLINEERKRKGVTV